MSSTNIITSALNVYYVLSKMLIDAHNIQFVYFRRFYKFADNNKHNFLIFDFLKLRAEYVAKVTDVSLYVYACVKCAFPHGEGWGTIAFKVIA